jgi:hypothetical protein
VNTVEEHCWRHKRQEPELEYLGNQLLIWDVECRMLLVVTWKTRNSGEIMRSDYLEGESRRG